jgi:hypothetical protein
MTSPATPDPAPAGTVRERLRDVLREGPASTRDLSQRVGIREHEVADHLTHLARSLPHRGERLVTDPPQCLDCDFVFTERQRYTRPGHCPRCRGRRVTQPRFRVESA